jgi:hypothetical protein
MTFDDQLRRTMATLTDRLREEAERQMTALTAEFHEAIKSERAAAAAQASADARTAAERDLAERLTAAATAAAAHEQEAVAAAVAAAVASIEAKSRDALAAAEARINAARESGRAEGYAAGRAEGEDSGRAEGRREGLEEGLKDGRVDGRIEGREEGREEGRLEGKRAGHELGFKEGKRIGREEARKEALATGVEKGRLDSASELAASERLLDAIRAIDEARSLTEALDSLARAAGREAARVAVLLVRRGTLRGWRFIGFGAPLDERHDFLVPSADAGVVAEAALTGSPVSADSAATRSAPAFAGLAPGREVLAVPVQISGQVVAVLYADQGADPASVNNSWPKTLEVLARYAARSLESMTAFRAAQVLTARPDLSSDTSAAAERYN